MRRLLPKHDESPMPDMPRLAPAETPLRLRPPLLLLSPLSLLSLLLLFSVSGCALVPGQSHIPLDQQSDSRHHFYRTPKELSLDGSRVVGLPKMNPKWWIENSDDPLPWWWKPDEPIEVRRRTWSLRNPLHNFTNYVIGVKDRHTHRIGINAHSIWNDKGPINLTVTQAGPLIYLPMISYRGSGIEGYLGWRTSGSFGGALRRAQHDSDGTGPRGNSPKSRARQWLAEQEAKKSGEAKEDPLSWSQSIGAREQPTSYSPAPGPPGSGDRASLMRLPPL